MTSKQPDRRGTAQATASKFQLEPRLSTGGTHRHTGQLSQIPEATGGKSALCAAVEKILRAHSRSSHRIREIWSQSHSDIAGTLNI